MKSKATMHLTNEIDNFIGKRIKIVRAIKGMTQEELGNKMGVTLQQVQKYERGLNRCSASRLYLAAKALSVNLSFFYKGCEDKDEEDIVSFISQLSFADQETIDLAKAYTKISDPDIRKKFLSLIQAVSSYHGVINEANG